MPRSALFAGLAITALNFLPATTLVDTFEVQREYLAALLLALAIQPWVMETLGFE